jgi:hypothetical protein
MDFSAKSLHSTSSIHPLQFEQNAMLQALLQQLS